MERQRETQWKWRESLEWINCTVLCSPLFWLQPLNKNIHHSPFTWTAKQIRFPSLKDHSTNPISHHFLCMLHFHPICESVPRLCSECLITAVKRMRGIEGGGGESFHQMNDVSIFHFARERGQTLMKYGEMVRKQSLGTFQFPELHPHFLHLRLFLAYLTASLKTWEKMQEKNVQGERKCVLR